MTNRWMTWLAKLATQCAVVALAATWGSAAFAQGRAPGGEFSGSLQQGSAGTADYWAEEGTASTRVSQTQYIDEYGNPVGEMQGPPPTFYDANIPNDYGVGYAVTEDLNEVFYRVGRVNRAFNQESTSINAFIPIGVDMDQNLWFFNPRAMFTDESRGGASLGFGRRFYVPEEDRVYGMSAWWDYDAGHAGSFHQMGGSFEAIGRYLQWRFNFSLPLNDTHEHNFTMADPFFIDDNIGFLEFRDVETAYQQYDLEAAIPVPLLGRYGVTWGVGPYFLNGRGNEDAWGVSTRAEIQVTEDLWANLQVTSDKITGGNAFLNFEFTLPNGMPRQVASQLPVRDWMTQSVRRNYRVVTNTENRGESNLFIDPEDGLPIRVAHIDPNDNTPGDGTVEDPYESVEDFMGVPAGPRGDYDIIFVRRNANGSDNDLNTTITLLECQRLLGDGVTHQFDSTLGTFTLPGFTPGPTPLLSNSAALVPGSPVITLGHGNEVSGFTIDAGDTGDGIFGAGIDGFNINRNTIRNVVNGIVITSDTTPLTGCPIEDLAIIEDNVIIGNGFGSIDGVNLIHTAGDLDLLIADNTVSGFAGEDSDGDGVLAPSEDLDLDGNLDPGEDANLNGVLDLGEDVDGDGVVDQGRGIAVLNLGGTINADNPGSVLLPTGITGNTVTGSGTGIQIVAAAGSVDTNLVIDGNTITGSTNGLTDPLDPAVFLAAGLDVVAAGAGTTVDIDSVTGNVITGGAGDGASFRATGGGIMTFADPTGSGDPVVTGNTFESNDGHGATFEAEGVASLMDIENVSENSFDSNGLNGANFEARAGGSVILEVFQTNTSAGNTRDGVAILADGAGSTAEFTIGGLGFGEGNNLTGNVDDGISITANDDGEVSGAVLGNDASGNLNGMNVSGTAGGIVNLNDSVAGFEIMSNDFSGNTAVGVILSAFDGDVDVLLQDNAIDSNGSFGIRMLNDTLVGPSTLNAVIGGPDPSALNTITGNGDAGIASDFLGTSVSTVLIQNNSINGNVNAANVDFDGEGIHLRAGEFAVQVANILDNAISGNAGTGAKQFANGNAEVFSGLTPGFNLQRNTITGNGAGNLGGGVNIERDGDSIVFATLFDNAVDGNTGSGLDVTTFGGNSGTADTRVIAEDNTFSNNTVHGANFTIDGASATFAHLECNIIDANGVNGINVVTDNSGFFGSPPGTPSEFGGNTTTNHVTGAGIALTQLGVSSLLVEITSADCDTIISNNADGVVLNHSGVGGQSILTIGDPGNPFPDITIDNNTDDAIEYNITGAGLTSLTVNNAQLSGTRLTGGVSDNGIEVSYNNASATSSLTVRDSIITNFGDDGVNVNYNRNNDVVGSFTMLVEDSAVGLDLFNFNGEDGFDLTVSDGGASFIIRDTDVRGNGEDGVFLLTLAEDDNPGARGQFNGNTLFVPSNVDTNGNGIPDSVDQNNPFLYPPFYPFGNFPWGDNNPNLIDYTTSLTIDDGSRVDFNRTHGVHLEVGSQTNQIVSLQGSSFSGNTISDLHFIPVVSGDPTRASVNNGEGNPDEVVLDPVSHLDLFFGDIAPNTGNRITSSTLGPSIFTGPDGVGTSFFNGPAADPFKQIPRPVNGFFTVTLPDPFAPPTPNDFSPFGLPVDETTLFPGWVVIPL